MRIDYNAPTEYLWDMPIIDSNGNITERVWTGTENVLAGYEDVAKVHAVETDNNPDNYCLSEIYVVGSGTRHRADSDLDLLLIAPRLDIASAKIMKVILAFMFFTDRPKQEAIDVFIRQKDIYPERGSVNITAEVKRMLDRCNSALRHRH